MPKQLISTAQAAEMLGVRPQTMRIWRVKGCGPKYVRYGGTRGKVFYHPDEIQSWLVMRTYDSTSEESARRRVA
ncbi:hypothetical protein JXA40_11615 [bacterium]|nr:hypothetical protein [candidate division CSSED10-310 bacterium]